jgi:hypothetical protein
MRRNLKLIANCLSCDTIDPMKKYLRTIIFPVTLLLMVLSSCSNRPYFRIENQSSREVRIEWVFDTVDLPEVVARFITNRDRNMYYCTDCARDRMCDSIYQQLKSDGNISLLRKYLYDSLELGSFFRERYHAGNPFSAFELEPQDDPGADFNILQRASAYYRSDSIYLQKIWEANTLTFFLKPGELFFKQCRSCGDCSCSSEEAFPEAKEIRVVLPNGNRLALTRSNFRKMLQKQTIDSESDSYVLEVPEILTDKRKSV